MTPSFRGGCETYGAAQVQSISIQQREHCQLPSAAARRTEARARSNWFTRRPMSFATWKSMRGRPKPARSRSAIVRWREFVAPRPGRTGRTGATRPCRGCRRGTGARFQGLRRSPVAPRSRRRSVDGCGISRASRRSRSAFSAGSARADRRSPLSAQSSLDGCACLTVRPRKPRFGTGSDCVSGGRRCSNSLRWSALPERSSPWR